MNTQVVLTADGSHSVYNPEVGHHYHSVYGAVQESQRVYVELGLWHAFDMVEGPIRVFEMGFGTGLNALMTLREAIRHNRSVEYVAIEPYPIDTDDVRQLNYDDVLNTFWLADVHDAPWDVPTPITPYMMLTKYQTPLEYMPSIGLFDVVYYDAFPPEGQPELWTQEIFEKVASMMHKDSFLTTYCSKTTVQNNLRAAGFTVEKHSGPARKREVIRAVLK
jgi:tRNA U34 5-methylaminomethyl-2-thiouridine-forming methyltransferase MnmC